MGGITWALGRTLAEHLAPAQLVPGDRALSLARAVKSPWELAILRAAGADHDRCLRELLPARIAPGMTEREIAHRVWEVLFAAGHQGLLRMENYGEEVFLGHVSAGESGNYPSVFNGPVGLRGEHPATPHMGSAKRWERGEPLVCDIGFVRSGYHTDKTQVYFAGPRAAIPARAAAAHEFCVEVQAWVAAQLRPGSVPSQLAEHCFAWAERAGWAEGFMALGGNKVRFIGHGIGLAIDEYPVIAKGFDAPLEEGMLLALEPKIGIPGLGMVGVENTFEVTPDGGRCVRTPKPAPERNVLRRTSSPKIPLDNCSIRTYYLCNTKEHLLKRRTHGAEVDHPSAGRRRVREAQAAPQRIRRPRHQRRVCPAVLHQGSQPGAALHGHFRAWT